MLSCCEQLTPAQLNAHCTPGLNAENDEARQEVAYIKERLLENVVASRDRPHKGQCAANSISLLNAAGFPLTGMLWPCGALIGHRALVCPMR
jgi:hypothetical protein